jgi:hypothetical protein
MGMGNQMSSTPTNVVVMNALVGVTFDYITLTQTTTSDVWNYYLGGSGGTLRATVTINYTDSTKATIQSVGRS